MIGLTGSSGFVGAAVVAEARLRGQSLRMLVRSSVANENLHYEARAIGDLNCPPLDPAALSGCNVIIHAAARAHCMDDGGKEELAAYRRTNVNGTIALLAAMEAAGVHRIVYVSSIKALGERTRDIPLRPFDERRPEDAYGRSKAEAEDVICAAHVAGRVDAVIVRPVLVYGPGAKGNLVRLMTAIRRGQMLPLGGVQNRRSLVGVSNLADALLTVATSARSISVRSGMAPIYHVADDGVISSRRLVQVLAQGLGVAPRLVNVPRWIAVPGASLLGKGALARRLFADFEIDDEDFRRDFGWRPKIDLEEGLRLMAGDFARCRPVVLK